MVFTDGLTFMAVSSSSGHFCPGISLGAERRMLKYCTRSVSKIKHIFQTKPIFGDFTGAGWLKIIGFVLFGSPGNAAT
jgi:hypothetical protein